MISLDQEFISTHVNTFISYQWAKENRIKIFNLIYQDLIVPDIKVLHACICINNMQDTTLEAIKIKILNYCHEKKIKQQGGFQTKRSAHLFPS